MNAAAKPEPSSKHEEPEITQEEAVPNDGKDIEGEEMMKQVVNEKLEEKPGEEKDAKD